jgi:hypothetical protein
MKKLVSMSGLTLGLLLLGSVAYAAPNESGISKDEANAQRRVRPAAADSALRSGAGNDSSLVTQVQTDEMRTQSSPESRKAKLTEKWQGQAGSRREVAEDRLEAARLRACQAREKGIAKRTEKLMTRAERMTSKFTEIASKVGAYYTGALIPAGIEVENYNILQENIAAKRVAVDVALAQAQETNASFSCELNNPKAAMILFRSQMQDVNTALREHRVAVKGLIVAVRAAVSNESPDTSLESER